MYFVRLEAGADRRDSLRVQADGVLRASQAVVQMAYSSPTKPALWSREARYSFLCRNMFSCLQPLLLLDAGAAKGAAAAAAGEQLQGCACGWGRQTTSVWMR